jgi:hypothetical protein
MGVCRSLPIITPEFAQALRGMIEPAGGRWRGSASELPAALAAHARPNATKPVQWPKTPKLLATALRGILPQLGTIGITVNFDRAAHGRVIAIARTHGSRAADGLPDGHILG